MLHEKWVSCYASCILGKMLCFMEIGNNVMIHENWVEYMHHEIG